jgi:DNA-binding MarR family transcriptional regulator
MNMRNQSATAQAVAKSPRRGRPPAAVAAAPIEMETEVAESVDEAAPAHSTPKAVATDNAETAKRTAPVAADQLVTILRDTIVSLVRRDGPDLSARQLGVFLTCYLQEGAHTVRGLAADLNVSKPAITRALDRLGELDLARRKVDPMDRRSVLVQRTLKGTAFLRDLRGIMAEASAPKTARKAG